MIEPNAQDLVIPKHMEDLHKIAASANITLKNEPGFLGCSVIGNPPSALCYEFDSPQNAERYGLERALVRNSFSKHIEGANLIEQRTGKKT